MTQVKSDADEIASSVSRLEDATREGLENVALAIARAGHDLAESMQLVAAMPLSQPKSAVVLEWTERLRAVLDTRIGISGHTRDLQIVIDCADLRDLQRIGEIIEAGSD
jgi:hypothetical protein